MKRKAGKSSTQFRAPKKSRNRSNKTTKPKKKSSNKTVKPKKKVNAKATKSDAKQKPTSLLWRHKDFQSGCGEVKWKGKVLGAAMLQKHPPFTDSDGKVQYHLIVDWLMPSFGGGSERISFYEWLGDHMQVYATNNPCARSDGIKFTPDVVRRFFGCQMARSLRGLPSIEQCYDSREPLSHVASITESLQRDVYQACHACIHFSTEETEGDIWHSRKFSEVEEAFSARWQACVRGGRGITMDESRVAGWYHSGMTVGPEPKPVRTGATAHTVCVTKGKFSRFLLLWRTYGGRTDEALSDPGVGKWIQLMDIILKPWYGKGHIVTMDSAYVSEKWMDHAMQKGLNVVGTFQWNRFGPSKSTTRKLTDDEVKKGLAVQPFDVNEVEETLHLQSHESMFSQRENGKITLSVWGDNNRVRVASNIHDAEVLPDGVKRHTRDSGRISRQCILPADLQQD